MKELISVIIPVYNRERFVEDAIRSIAGQSYRPVEVVVVDDGSSDASSSRARAALAGCGLPGWVYSIDNSGPDAARDFGIGKSNGTLIAFLDSDDLYHPCYLEMMVSVLKLTGVPWCFSDFYVSDAGGNPQSRKSASSRRLFSDADEVAEDVIVKGDGLFSSLLVEQPIFMSGLLLTRSFYDQAGPFTKVISERIHSLEWEFLLRSARLAPIGYLNRPLVSIRKHDGNMSGAMIRQEEGEISVLKTVLQSYSLSAPEKRLVRSEIARRSWEVGCVHLSENRRVVSRRFFLDSFRHKKALKPLWYLFGSSLPSTAAVKLRRLKRLLTFAAADSTKPQA